MTIRSVIMEVGEICVYMTWVMLFDEEFKQSLLSGQGYTQIITESLWLYLLLQGLKMIMLRIKAILSLKEN